MTELPLSADDSQDADGARGEVGPPKSGKPRLVPVIAPLATILSEWKLATGGEGLLFKPLTPWRQRSKHIKDSTVRAELPKAFVACGLPESWTWYNVSRHTYASQHVIGGGSRRCGRSSAPRRSG